MKTTKELALSFLSPYGVLVATWVIPSICSIVNPNIEYKYRSEAVEGLVIAATVLLSLAIVGTALMWVISWFKEDVFQLKYMILISVGLSPHSPDHAANLRVFTTIRG